MEDTQLFTAIGNLIGFIILIIVLLAINGIKKNSDKQVKLLERLQYDLLTLRVLAESRFGAAPQAAPPQPPR